MTIVCCFLLLNTKIYTIQYEFRQHVNKVYVPVTFKIRQHHIQLTTAEHIGFALYYLGQRGWGWDTLISFSSRHASSPPLHAWRPLLLLHFSLLRGTYRKTT